jgi:hypothetical protein
MSKFKPEWFEVYHDPSANSLAWFKTKRAAIKFIERQVAPEDRNQFVIFGVADDKLKIVWGRNDRTRENSNS